MFKQIALALAVANPHLRKKRANENIHKKQFKNF